MSNSDLLAYLVSQKWAVEATISESNSPQAALIGFATTDSFELVFDTSKSTRKAKNLQTCPTVALVIGGWIDGDERTVQYEGLADIPEGEVLEALKAVYFKAFPDGKNRQTSPDLIYVRVRPKWIRYSNFNGPFPETHEFNF